MDRNGVGSWPHGMNPLSLSARRAWIEIPCPSITGCVLDVALRKESVDRNQASDMSARREAVALRKESVDRNTLHVMFLFFFYKSLSARRAWIEILFRRYPARCVGSLSARRAWIEIVRLVNGGAPSSVALRKESVDRNGSAISESRCRRSRSPQGERG